MKKDLEYKEPPCSNARGRYRRVLAYKESPYTIIEWRKSFKTSGRILRVEIAKVLAAKKAKGTAHPRLTAEDLFTIASNNYLYGLNGTTGVFDSFWRGYKQARNERVTQQCDQGWQPVPWAREPWFFDSPYEYTHMAHMSLKVPGNIAFADSPQKLIADQFTSMKPGRYLTKYFGDVLTEDQIRVWSERCAAMLLDQEQGLKFIESNDPVGWMKVYSNGPGSCMTGEPAVQIYAHPESVLRLAYLEFSDGIKARAIVREDRKEYVRIYPSSGDPNYTRMRQLLAEAGYTHGNLNGCKLAKVRTGNTYFMPYIDCGIDGTQQVTDRGEHFVVTHRGKYDATNTSGLLETGVECPCCGTDGHDEDDMTYIESEEQSVCPNCLDDEYVRAIGRNGYADYYHRDSSDVIYCESDEEYYVERWAGDHDVIQCEVSGSYYKLDDMCSTSRGYVHGDDCVSLDVPDSEGNDYAYKRDAVKTTDGRTIHKDDAVTVLVEVVHHKDDKQLDLDLTNK
jgi:hypothetical protein